MMKLKDLFCIKAHPDNDTFEDDIYLFTYLKADYYLYTEDGHMGLGITYEDWESGSYSATPIYYYLNDVLSSTKPTTSHDALHTLFRLKILKISYKDKLEIDMNTLKFYQDFIINIKG